MVVTAICFGLSIVLSIDAVMAGFPETPFSAPAMLWMLLAEIGLAFTALLFLRSRGYDVATLAPRPTLRGSAIGIGLFFAAWLVGFVLVTPFAVDQPEQPITAMMAGARIPLPLLVAFAMVNGVYEEVFLLGYLVRGLRGFGLSVAIGVPLLVRISYHLYQGPLGALWIVAFGLVFALYYVRSGDLWPVAFAHILWDIVPFVSM